MTSLIQDNSYMTSFKTDTWDIIIGGKDRKTNETIAVHFPYTGAEITRVSCATAQEITEALTSAEAGFAITKTLPLHTRIKILTELASKMEAMRQELTETIIMEGGKTRTLAEEEVKRSILTIQHCAEAIATHAEAMIPLDRVPAGEGKSGTIVRVPIGIIVGITPFNFPLNLVCHKLGPAVAAGNAVIIKASSKTPLSALMLGKMLLAAGFPPQALSILVCNHPETMQLTCDPRVALVSFTGSGDIGQKLRAQSAVPRMMLELGGNAAVIIEDDSDLAAAAKRIVQGGFNHAGQVCISVQRVFIKRTIYNRMISLILDNTTNLIVGDPRDPCVTVSPMITPEAAKKVKTWINEAVEAGAVMLHGGTYTKTCFTPTILEKTTPDMKVNAEEIFAPVITCTPYDTFEEALQLANNSKYGLQTGIFTKHIDQIRYAFEMLDVGCVIINDIPTFRLDHMPYGGVKSSGIGREGPAYAIREMTTEKMLIIS
ncbi:MAG: aldehyde dehydrogenase family protein [Methanomicrobiales archaeon]|nr:aldehyde dehydrogenase family protein [Methanomicrobiales archaeon]